MFGFAHLVGDHPPRKSGFSVGFQCAKLLFLVIGPWQVGNGLGEHEGDRVEFRRRLAGAFGVALAFGFFEGVAAIVESFEGSGIALGIGASTC